MWGKSFSNYLISAKGSSETEEYKEKQKTRLTIKLALRFHVAVLLKRCLCIIYWGCVCARVFVSLSPKQTHCAMHKCLRHRRRRVVTHLSVFCFSLSSSRYVCCNLSVSTSKFLVNLYPASNCSDNSTKSRVASCIGTSDIYNPFLRIHKLG